MSALLLQELPIKLSPKKIAALIDFVPKFTEPDMTISQTYHGVGP